LGPLETKVLEFLWSQGCAVTVRHVHLLFPELAYTTLMTTLDRLYRKGVLIRRPRGRAFAYEPRCSRDEMLGELMSGHVADLLTASGASGAILSTLVQVVGRTDAALLDELDALVQAERTRLKVTARELRHDAVLGAGRILRPGELAASILVAAGWAAGLNRMHSTSAGFLVLRMLPAAGAALLTLTVVLPLF